MPGFNDGFFDERSSFDPSDITIDDNTSGAFLIKEGSNEYMRIDTTNGAEKTIFKTQSGPNTGFFVNTPVVGDALSIIRGGSPATFIRLNAGTTLFQVDSSTILADLISSVRTFKVDGTPGTTPLTIEGTGDTVFTLDETNAARFRIMDNGAATGVGSTGPITYLDIQSSNNNTASGDYIKLGLEPEANGRYFELTSSYAKLYCQNAKLDLTTAAATFTLYDDFSIRQYQSGKRILVCEDAQNGHEALTVDKTADSTFNIFAPSSGVPNAPAAGSSFKVRRRESGGTVDCLTIAPDSATTFTLDDTSGATFKVTDNGASPKTFFGATEGGNTFVQSDSSTFLDGGGAIYLRVGTSDRIRADGGALYLGGTGKFNIVDAGTPFYNRSTSLVDIGATTGTTVVNIQSDGAYKALKCTPTTTSQTFTLEFQDGSSANGVHAIEQHFAIYNAGTENCTIQATITSGRGSALGKDLSAGGSTSGELVAGMTLNAGKSALFKAVKWNKILTGAATAVDNQFMFQTIMVEA